MKEWTNKILVVSDGPVHSSVADVQIKVRSIKTLADAHRLSGWHFSGVIYATPVTGDVRDYLEGLIR
jgi:hypothetical protein